MGRTLAQLQWTDEATGLVCQAVQFGVLREPHWCGYVIVPPGHPWHGLDCNSIAATIHGGLTYSDREGTSWKVGFDAAHAGDGWQDEAWVRAECASLAAQAASAKKDEPLADAVALGMDRHGLEAAARKKDGAL